MNQKSDHQEVKKKKKVNSQSQTYERDSNIEISEVIDDWKTKN